MSACSFDFSDGRAHTLLERPPEGAAAMLDLLDQEHYRVTGTTVPESLQHMWFEDEAGDAGVCRFDPDETYYACGEALAMFSMKGESSEAWRVREWYLRPDSRDCP